MTRLANWLPWAAAISFGALVGAWVFSGFFGDVRTVYPYALGLSALVGVPMAMRHRGGRDWGKAAAIVAVGVIVLLLARSCSESGAAMLLLAISRFFLLVPMAVCLVLFALPTAALILWLSGERRATAQGTSIANLPHGRLRVAALLLLTLAPLAVYTSDPARDCGEGTAGIDSACDRPAPADSFNH